MSEKKQKVALVLASGGAKGFAHIGAIEALEDAGYAITSVAGTSMGALVGGIYAAGGLDKVKEWMYQLTREKVISLFDFTWSPRALIRGESLMIALQQLVPDCPIESLRIPYCASATDLKTGHEVTFSQGSLYDAIRSSISLPMVFTPVAMNQMLLVDGGITNGLPLDRVSRTEGDMLVAVNLEDYQYDESKPSENPIWNQHPTLTKPIRKLQAGLNALSNNYLTMVYDMIAILMKRNTEMALRLTPPDIYLNVDVHEYGSYDYDKAESISRLGYEQMTQLLLARPHCFTENKPARKTAEKKNPIKTKHHGRK